MRFSTDYTDISGVAGPRHFACRVALPAEPFLAMKFPLVGTIPSICPTFSIRRNLAISCAQLSFSELLLGIFSIFERAITFPHSRVSFSGRNFTIQ